MPTADRVRRLEQMASAATALTTSKMEFSNELTYVHSMAPKSKLEEGGMQVSKFLLKIAYYISYFLVPNSTLLEFQGAFMRG